MYSTEADVARWLSSITDLKHDPLPLPTESGRVDYEGRQRKRRKLSTNRHKLPSPPPSELSRTVADMPPSLLKRPRDPEDPVNRAHRTLSTAQPDEAHDQITPRPGRFQQTQTAEWIPFSAGSSHGSQSWTSSASSHSAPVLKRPKSVFIGFFREELQSLSHPEFREALYNFSNSQRPQQLCYSTEIRHTVKKILLCDGI
ncbi:hypothetical protein HZS61_002330 [Fusarium oxysporum f. sp. conglutinans]|uniref:Uncharacterized protein n=1 Tax=Fusarium oxysporum f. sp. conglutinans TaxID=100902 RepID=A0A8H6LF60_FUSOX|nr:hypothetical protein HZS61_002330 [Fusarium oxysporum f. sp. conglutinans]KAG7000384.1 hypothetical protein FocnCong_v012545 [Fusarium oxysporum f. sp. conglutinans]KAI8406236.1 hypothetical protein FOFC_13705 [Fusarium oxysporum]